MNRFVSMNRTAVFSTIALLYFIGCAIGTNAVSQSIAQYIGRHGWKHYNFYSLIVGGLLGLIFLGLLGYRLSIQRPTRLELTWGISGLIGTVYVMTQFVLLTTEYVHIPQFTLLTLILCIAFPNHLLNALIFSTMGCIADEWIQAWMPDRRLDLNDVFLNFIGMYVGLIVWWCLSGFQQTSPVMDSTPISETAEKDWA